MRSRLDLPEPFGPTTRQQPACRRRGRRGRRRRAGRRARRRGRAPRRQAGQKLRIAASGKSRPRSLEAAPESGVGLRNPLYRTATGATGAPPRRQLSDEADGVPARDPPRSAKRRRRRAAILTEEPALSQPSLDTFKCRRTLDVGGKTYTYFSLPEAEKNGLAGISRLPFSLKVLLENLLRFEDGRTVTADDIRAVARMAEEALLRPRDRLPAGARADAGFHRRAGGGRPRRHARRHDPSRRRPAQASIRWCRSTSSSTIR